MSNIIPLSGGANLPAYLTKRKTTVSTINDDVPTGGTGFPVLSIKGKVFTLVKDGERKVLTRADDPDEVLQNITMTVVRANAKSRVFYAKSYNEDDAEGAKPDCYSSDGVAPAADSRNPQAKKCALCPHAVWGSGNDGKGTACKVNTRLAVVDPDKVGVEGMEGSEPFLLRVPAGSRQNFADIVKAAKARSIDYNMLALKVGFDKDAPSPKLTFKIVGLIGDEAYAKVDTLYTDETVMDIVGLAPVAAAQPALSAPESTATEDDLEAALAAKKAITRAAKPKPAPVVEEDEFDGAVAAPAPVAPPVVAKTKTKPKPAPVEADDVDDLLGGLDALLSASDD